jgi:hypothetical protein
VLPIRNNDMSGLCREGGEDIQLTVDNVDEYVKLLPRVILVDSIRAQLDAFRNGFRSEYLHCTSLPQLSCMQNEIIICSIIHSITA